MERVLGVIKDLQFSIGSLVGHSDFLVNPTIRITNQEISISNGFGGSGRGSRCSPQPFSFENAEIRKRQRTCFLVVFFVWGVYFQGYVSPRVPFCSFFSSRGIKPSLRTFFDWRTRRNKCIQSTNVNLETTKRSTTMFSQKMLCVCVGLCVSRVGEIVQWCVRRNDSCNYSHGWVFLLLRFRDHWDCLFLNVALVYFGGGVWGGRGVKRQMVGTNIQPITGRAKNVEPEMMYSDHLCLVPFCVRVVFVLSSLNHLSSSMPSRNK